ncbi:MAG: hypothetical protein ACREQC_00785 [Candidatus Binataceae bacterium]
MNPNQFATLSEAKAIAQQLNSIGGGVRPFADDDSVSGIYIPDYFGPYPTPSIGDSKFYHFRFNNGAEGFNVGLIRLFMQVFPTSWSGMISAQVNGAAA